MKIETGVSMNNDYTYLTEYVQFITNNDFYLHYAESKIRLIYRHCYNWNIRAAACDLALIASETCLCSVIASWK